MATSAREGEPEPNRADGFGPVEQGGVAELLLIRTAFRVGQSLAVKGSGESLVGRCIREQIAGDLLDRELVHGHVRVHRFENPVPVVPGIGTRVVFLIAVGVGVAALVQPVPPPSLPKVFRSKEPLHQRGVSIGRIVIHEGIHFGRARREPNEIIIEPLDQDMEVRPRRRFDFLLLQAREDKAIDRIPHPLFILHLRQHPQGQGKIRPVPLSLGHEVRTLMFWLCRQRQFCFIGTSSR